MIMNAQPKSSFLQNISEFSVFYSNDEAKMNFSQQVTAKAGDESAKTSKSGVPALQKPLVVLPASRNTSSKQSKIAYRNAGAQDSRNVKQQAIGIKY